MQTSFIGANVYTGLGFERMDIRLKDGIVASVSPSESLSELNNLFIFPGLADVHVHLREPGFSYKEDIATGSAAAAAGGYTDVCAMPNLNPVPDCREHLAEELAAIEEKAVVRVHPYGSLTVNEAGAELADLEGMAADVVAFSDDGKGLASDDAMLAAMSRAKALDRLIAAHCEDMTVIGGANVHDGKAAAKLGIKGITSESEWRMIERDIELARRTGCPYHVCHVSTKESVELIRRAKADGVDITCETGPHYLLLSEDDIVREIDSLMNSGASLEEAQLALGRFKMNPPLRGEEDRKALVEGFLDGTIDMIATDHAPHATEEKLKGLLGGPMGVVGLECAFPVMYTGFVKTGLMTLEELVRRMSVVPRDRFFKGSSRIPAGAHSLNDYLQPGRRADMCVYDLGAEYDINPDEFASKGRYTPFTGRHVIGRCVMTVCDGRIVFDRTEGAENAAGNI